MNYKNLFDPQTGLMRGKNKDGSFETPFSPFKWGDALPKETAGTIPGAFSMILTAY
jgi:putative alpha-1,2-mannosidase